MTEQTPPGYLLGEMAATVKSIDQNVNKIREELGDLGKRLGHVETELATIQAERHAVMPEYYAFLKIVRQHMSDINNWKSQVEGGINVAKGSGKLVHTFIGAILTLALFIAGQIWTDHRVEVEKSAIGQVQ